MVIFVNMTFSSCYNRKDTVYIHCYNTSSNQNQQLPFLSNKILGNKNEKKKITSLLCRRNLNLYCSTKWDREIKQTYLNVRIAISHKKYSPSYQIQVHHSQVKTPKRNGLHKRSLEKRNIISPIIESFEKL